MFYWRKNKKPTWDVFLGFDQLNVKVTGTSYQFLVAKDLGEWIAKCGKPYKFRYDTVLGKRWIEFYDEETAVQCKLIYGG